MTSTLQGTVAARIFNGTKIYGEGHAEVRALDDVSVEFQKGRFTAIMGPSGSGKSTLLHCIAGLDELTSGETFIGDVELGSLKDRALTLLRREKVGFIFQAYNLIPTLSASENITLPLDIARKDIDQDWFDQVITTIGLENRLSHLPTELSGGEQQRVAAARALVSRPKIIFADEPSGNLDSTSAGELLDFMKQAVTDLGQTIVMVTHDPGAAGYSDRVVFLGDGRVVGELLEPTSDAIFDRMRELGG
ncbi:MAG: ABC transporter ATP-binding protein [Acidimicrobiia bacterium]